MTENDEESATQDLGSTVRLGHHTVFTGSCSWTDRTLVEDSDWYPQRTMSPEDRL
ncbi:MAG: hypothetical protein JO039_21745, partial [Solirubrobacterales bacterium]|nr:hypothetical protein [Solirubrobacterales bacterium]